MVTTFRSGTNYSFQDNVFGVDFTSFDKISVGYYRLIPKSLS